MRNILKDRTAFKILFIFFHELFLEHMVWILQGVQKNPQNYWTNVLLEFECPSTKLNAKMRKILTRVHILNIDLLRN
jgi:hypothetical protein